jgi:hypothetical protein
MSYRRWQKPVKNAVPDNEWTVTGKVVKSLSPVFKPREAINPPATAHPRREARS